MANQSKLFSLRIFVQLLLVLVVLPFLPLLISWRWDWWEAWVYAILWILGFIVSRILAARQNPDLLAERANFMQHENTQPWDKLLAPLLGIGSGSIPLVAGMDARWGWSPSFSLALKIIGLVFIMVGYVLSIYALVENRFFSGVVRLQSERGHKVISSGPYRWMRHPGYTGGLMTYLASPLFLDSVWAFLPAVAITIILIIRTNLEDKFLQDELAGYRDYAKCVHYRLLPGVW